jgi:hypothetical protein
MDTEAFKKEVKPHLDSAIADNGGIEQVYKMHSLMPAIVDFIAGWTAKSVQTGRRSFMQTTTRDLSQEEIRRIYDLVRLRIDTGSATS